MDDFRAAVEQHFGGQSVGFKENEPIRSSKGIPQTVAEVMAGVHAATEPNGVPWYLGEWPADNPFAQRTRLLGQEAQRFTQTIGARAARLAASKDQDPWEQLGVWFNETWTNSPNVTTREEVAQYWAGGRRSLEAQTQDLTQAALHSLYVKERYKVQSQMTEQEIKDTIFRIEGKVRDAEAQTATLSFAGAVTGLVTGLTIMVFGKEWLIAQLGSRLGLVTLIRGFAPIVLGGAGAAAPKVLEDTADLTHEINILRDLKERRNRLHRDGVRIETIDGAMTILRRARNLIGINVDEGRRRQIIDMAKHSLNNLLKKGGQRKELLADLWSDLIRRAVAAGNTGNVDAVADAFTAIADLGNQIHQELDASSNRRVQRLLLGWSRIQMIDPLAEGEEYWY